VLCAFPETSFIDQSPRRATAGSTRTARRAGPKLAAAATVNTTTASRRFLLGMR
jgi:hypothetical protein